MAHIRLTFQKPDETETHEIAGDDGDSEILGSHIQNSSFQGTAAEECLAPLTWSGLSSRRGSGLLVSSSSDTAAACHPRKFSFPAALPSGLLGLESTGMGLLARRRFSNVSDAVTRKLSHTIGWRTSHSYSREIVAVGKTLCTQYIRSRLKRGGHLNRKCALQRLRSAVALPGGVLFREVYPELLGLGMELERLHPKLYVNVTRQASSAPGGKLTSEKDPGNILTAVSRELLKNELTWSKIVSLYAVAGGLAVDCVRQGHYDYLSSIVEAMEEILEEELAHWIQYKGGWLKMPYRLYYIAIKSSLYCSYSNVFGLSCEEVNALSKKHGCSPNGTMNGVIITTSPIHLINSLSELGYKVVCCSGESELTWTMMSHCIHNCQNSSACQTLDELDFERGIWYAAQHNDMSKVKEWIDKKDINALDRYGYTALHYASRNGHLEMCKLLISHGASVNALTRSGKVSPMHRCVSMGHCDIFKLLLESGAQMDVKDGDGKTVLHRAVEGGHCQLVEEILKLNPLLAKVTDRKGFTPKEHSNISGTLLEIFNKYE